MLSIIKFLILRLLWRMRNKHNYTRIGKLFNINKVSVGNFSYGKLNVYTYSDCSTKLKIGNFVSIADGVKFILGGNHNFQNFSTFPFNAFFFRQSESYSKGDIVIYDDVWIGTNSLILSGLSIGQGAIIAAGSIVTKDVSPYSIVGGNPAKLIKFRFNEATINKLLVRNLDNLNINKIKKNINFLNTPLNDNTIDQILTNIYK